MKLSELKPHRGAMKKKKRLGRGPGSGWGKTAGKGHKGQKARTGVQLGLGFEGGQIPLIRSTPKRGFHNLFRIEYQVVNLGAIDKKASGKMTIDPVALKKMGLIAHADHRVKILGEGTLSAPLTIAAHAFSASALEKIKNSNGKAEILAFGKGASKK